MTSLEIARRGRVEKLDLNPPMKLRLMEMGATPGTWVEVLRVSPLGDPVQIALRGYTLTLRGEDVRRILVMEE